MSYELANGPVPEGLMVLHTCDHGLCVNPRHLYVGTALDNARDMLVRGRKKHGSAVPQSKLKEREVSLIKALRLEGVRARTLSRLFGVSTKAIRSIFSGQSWDRVDPLERGLRG